MKLYIAIISTVLSIAGCGYKIDRTVPQGYPWGDWNELSKPTVLVKVTYNAKAPLVFKRKTQWDSIYHGTPITFDFDQFDLVRIESFPNVEISRIIKVQDRVLVNHLLKEVRIEVRYSWERDSSGPLHSMSHQAWYSIIKIPAGYKISYEDLH